MKIAIDAYGLRLDSGVRTYTSNLIRALEGLGHEVTVLYASEKDKMDIEHNEIVVGPTRKLFIPYRDNVRLYRHLARSDYDVFHVTRSTGPVFELNDTVVLRTIHDLCNRYTTMQRTDRLSKLYKRAVQKRVLENTDGILCPSESTKRQVADIFDVTDEDIYTTPLGTTEMYRKKPPEELAATRSKYGIDKWTILFVGVITPRKNVSTVADAFVQSGISDEYTLLITGSVGPGGEEIVTDIKNRYPTEDIQFPGFVSEEDLIDLYNIADLLIYPSYCEGFGLPVLEAMACGTPVIVSDTSSLPEVVGDAGLTVSPDDTAALAERMERVMTEKNHKKELEQQVLERAAQFSWERTADLTVEVYEKLVAQCLH